MGQPRPIFHLFSVFSTNQNNFYSKSMWKMSCPSILQCRDSNPQPLEHELSPITTWPALPPYFSIVYVRTYLCSSFHFKISLYYVVNLKKSTFQFSYPILELFDILVFEKIVNSLNLFLIIIRSQRC